MLFFEKNRWCVCSAAASRSEEGRAVRTRPRWETAHTWGVRGGGGARAAGGLAEQESSCDAGVPFRVFFTGLQKSVKKTRK